MTDTKPLKALKTLGITPFARCGPDMHLFSVNPDIPALMVVEYVVMLQDCINEMNMDYALGDRNEMGARASCYLGEMAKALMDELNVAMLKHR